MKRKFLIFPFLLFGCSYTYEHKDFFGCVTEFSDVNFRTSVESAYRDKGGDTYYGEPYKIQLTVGSKGPIDVERVKIRLTDGEGGYVRSYQGDLKKLRNQDGYYAWYVISDEYLPYEDINLEIVASGKGDVLEFECKLRKNYRRYERSYLDAVWSGV